MANTSSEVLLVLTSWNTASDDLTSQSTRTLVTDFCKNTLKSDEVSKLHCTVLDVEVSEDQKKDAEGVGVTLIPATRSKWADPDEDPPVVNWLFNHDKYYQPLKDLQNITHVISFSSKTKNAAAAIHESLFPTATLHLFVPTPPGVVFAFDVWSRNACGLTGYHRSIIQDFLVRKAKAGEHLTAYSTVVDVDLSADQIEDAEKCGVILIKATRQKGVDETPKIDWLMYHYSHFPDLQKLQNIKYVVGYAPKTGWAAVEIQQKLFRDAKLVLINHVCQEKNCLLVKDEFSDLEQEMLRMASHADLLFSIGPVTYGNFQRAYRAVINGRKLCDIPHKEILPKPRQQYFDNEGPDIDVSLGAGHSIITYGQLNTDKALKRCHSIAASVGSAANKHKDFGKKPLEWKIQGVSEQAYKETKNFLLKKLQSRHAILKPYKYNSTDSLLQSLQQSDLCLPPSCYTDYSFEGLEAMAAGLPTTVLDDSHLAAMIEKHFEDHKDYYVVRNNKEKLTSKIMENLTKNNVAIQQAKLFKKDLAKSEAVTESLAKFASSLTDEDAETQNSYKNVETGMKEERQEKKMAQMTESAMVFSEDLKTTETKDLLSHLSVNNDKDIKETTSVQPWMSVTEDVGTMHTTAEDVNTSDTTAVQPEFTVTEVMMTRNTTAETKDSKETTTPMQPGMSSIEDINTKESKAMQSGISATEGVDMTKPMRVQCEVIETAEETEKSDGITHVQIPEDAYGARTSRLGTPEHKDHDRKMKDKNNDIQHTQHKMLKKGDTLDEKKKSPGSKESGQKEIKAVKHKIQRKGKVSRNPDIPPTSPQSIAIESANDYTDIMVHVGLNKESYEQQMRDLNELVQTNSVRKKKKKLKAKWKKCQAQLDKSSYEVIANEESQRIVSYNCKRHFGNVKLKGTKQSSLAIHLDLPTVYNLYRLEHTCLSGSFPDSFEPLLITDKMREEADKVGLQLKLIATYNQARFDKLELFFINRDGGGLEPVKVYDDVIEKKDVEEIHIDDEDTDQESDTMVTGRVDSCSQIEQGQSLKDIQSKSEMERATLESQLKEAKEEKATLEQRCKELTQKLESTEQSLVSQRIGNSVEREKLQSELKENQLVKELQNKVGELEHQLEQSDLKKSGDKGDWSVTLVNGQHQDQGQHFKNPRGLAFHHDKLGVCDRGNNIVQILNKDYTCDKVLGSFDGQFAKPFQPLSVAISRFNHYFILDDENKQIVVCDENGKVIKIITLPENTKEVWDIALMDDFVLVTLSLTSPYIFVRPEDRGDKLVKYTQGGDYLTEVNGQISGQRQFYLPVSVVVNSNNVTMVYDSGNGCIKCFDSDLNILYQFGQSQISKWGIVGYYGYLAVDEDDNVYVCGFIDRILKYGYDGKWICDLFKGDVSKPLYIAVMGDKIGVVEYRSDQIKVFSK